MFTGDPPFFDNTQEKIFNNIRKGQLDFPDSISSEARDFIKKLMIKDPLERQKFIDSGDIKNHEWFKEISRFGSSVNS
jgi:serine/threonine protein kinase